MFFATLGVLIVFSCLVGAIIGIALSPYYGTDSPEAYDYLDRILKVFEPIFNIAFVIIPMVLIYFSLTRRHHQNFFDILRIHPISWKDGRRYIALGSGVAVIVIAVGVLIELIGFGYLIPDDMPITEEIQGGYGQMIFFTIMALLAGVTEEIINRGYIFQGLRHTWDQRAAAIIVTAFFILMHWPQLGYAITPLLFIVPIAVIFMMIRIKRDSLSYCMITHMSYNGTLLLLVWSYVLITGEPISAA
jgi:membrane protease YdiL (CAAX protease family)